MRKLLVIVLAVTMVFTLLSGCAKEGDTGESVKTGLAIMTTFGSSKDAGEEDGLAQTNSTVVAVTVDEEGVIRDCYIDNVQTKINFNASGEITTPMDSVFVGKQELGDNYGMKKASGIGKEWFEQANALAEYVTGKTIDEVKGISINEEGVATEAELTSTVTMHINDYLAAIEAAVSNATDMGAKAGDKIGIGLSSTIDHSANATAEENGNTQSYANVVALTMNDEGKITSCIIDAVQGNLAISAEGKIVGDLSAEPRTKNQLGDEYGMKKASGIGKEWNEQARAFADYVTGKTVAEVKGIAMNAEGVPTEAELTSSVTIHAGPLVGLIEKAAGNAE